MLWSLGIDRFTEDLQAVVLNLFENVPITTMSGMRLLEEVLIDIYADKEQRNDEMARFKRVVWMYPGEFLWRPYFWLFQKIWKYFF